MHTYYTVVLMLLYASLPDYICIAEMVKMKILDDYGAENRYDGGGYNDQWSAGNDNTGSNGRHLKIKMKPAPVNGPKYLQKLAGKCFKSTFGTYRYELCPYDNITQHEDAARWMPYQGVLGVWQSWRMSADHTRFKSWLYKDGDQCGQKARSVNVLIMCGETHKISNMSEPVTCEYEMTFLTPYACHHNSLLVYPTLNQTQRDMWDTLYTLYNTSHITQRGYSVGMQRVFQSAGYYMSEERRQALREQREAEVRRQREEGDGRQQRFNSLSHCSASYDDLHSENERLKKEIDRLSGWEGEVANVTVYNSTSGSQPAILPRDHTQQPAG